MRQFLVRDLRWNMAAATTLLVGSMLSSPAATWNVGSGNWNEGTNWNPVGVPNAAVAQIDNAGTASLTTNALNPVSNLRVGYGVGASGTLNIGADLTATASSSIGRSGVGNLSITGGTVRFNAATSSLRLGELAAGTGIITQSGGDVSTSNLLSIGVNGTNNAYTLTAGTFTNGSHFTIGSGTGSFGTMTQSGGTFVCLGTGQSASYIGQSGTGTLNLSGGNFKHFGSDGLILGSGATGIGTVNQTGGSLTVNNLHVGASGKGSYSIANGSLTGGGSLDVGLGALGGTFTVGLDAGINFGSGFSLGPTGTNKFIFGAAGVSPMLFGGAGTISSSGLIKVDGSAYSGGPASFTLIDAASFDNKPVIQLTGFALGASYTWDASNGNFKITVGQELPRLEARVSGGTVELSWPWTCIGWQLQVQTNAANAGLGTNWIALAESEATNRMTSPLASGAACVFYRLGPPPGAFDPGPAQGWQRADPQTMLRWAAFGNGSFNIYFGTDSTPDASEYKTNQSDELYYPGPLNTNTTYYWRVDVVQGSNIVTGPVWTFKTATWPGTNNLINMLSNSPSSYSLRDWKQVAQKYTVLASDFSATGKYLPVVSWDVTDPNFQIDTPFIPSFVGIPQGGDALNVFGTIIGASLVGIDMSQHGGHDWVRSMQQFQGTSVGRKVVGNNKTGQRSSGLWYDVVPGIYFSEAVELYPQAAQIQTPYSFQSGSASMEQVMYETADKWYQVLGFLGGSQTGIADFTGVVGFNTVTMEIDGRDGTHPGVLECAAGLAWVEFMAYRKFGDPKFLTGTRWALNYLDAVDRNPMHNGVQIGYGALAAARMNAELGYSFDVDQIFRWTFGEDTALREGWGVLYGSWNGYEVSGLIGTEAARGGANRAYAKQGFHMVGSLVPMVRYDQRYARAVGKWVLHTASSSRQYYQTYRPDGERDSPLWAGDPDGVVPFESLRGYHPQSYFQGYLADLDADPNSNPEVRALVAMAVTNVPAMWGSGYSGAVNGGIGLCLYFGGDVGILGGIIKPTNVEKILQLDLLRTDFYRETAYPSFLYYNPYTASQAVQLDVGPTPVDLYDTVTHAFIQTNVTGVQSITLPADSARVVVLTPTGGQATVVGRKLLINGVTVDFYHH